jgi:hypothetical protein
VQIEKTCMFFFQIALETIPLPVHIYKYIYIYIYFSFNPIKNYAMHASTFFNVARINIVLTQDTYKSYTFMFLFLLNHFYSDIFAFLPVYHTSERQNILIETNSPVGPYYIYSYLPKPKKFHCRLFQQLVTCFI